MCRTTENLDNVPTAHNPQDEAPVQLQNSACLVQMEKIINEAELAGGSSSSTPRKRKLKGQLRYCRDKIKKQDLKIKRLQTSNRRLKKKISKIDEVLASLEEKFFMSKENLDCLKNTNLKVCLSFYKLLLQSFLLLLFFRLPLFFIYLFGCMDQIL